MSRAFFLRLRGDGVDADLRDTLVAVGLLLLGELEAVFGPVTGPRWQQALVTVLFTVPLALRRRFPVLLLALVVVMGPTLSLINTRGGVMAYVLASIIASYTVGRELDWPQTWWGPGLTVGLNWVVFAAIGGELSDFVFVALLYGGAWAVGYAIRQREVRVVALTAETEHLRRRQTEREHQAVAEERARIARELHDIVSHSISVITIQTQAVRRRLPPERSAEIDDLWGIEATARQAMAEMRRLLGVLRADDGPPSLAPQPGLDQLQRLLADTRAAGVPVTLHVTGDPVPLPPGLDLAAYRVVQESLTNVRKHAAGASARAELRYLDNGLNIRVEDDGQVPAGTAHGGGHGLVGMRERIALYGGVLRAGRGDGGGWTVEAWLPVREQAMT
jgi:signal transduction histidine kinase